MKTTPPEKSNRRLSAAARGASAHSVSHGSVTPSEIADRYFLSSDLFLLGPTGTVDPIQPSRERLFLANPSKISYWFGILVHHMSNLYQS